MLSRTGLPGLNDGLYLKASSAGSSNLETMLRIYILCGHSDVTPLDCYR